MRIVVLSAGDCPNLPLLRRRLAGALHSIGSSADIVEHVVVDGGDLGGSPTILVDGRDPFPADPAPAGPACRLYPTPSGLQGAPTVDQLVAVLCR